MIMWTLFYSVWSHVFATSSSAERKTLRSVKTAHQWTPIQSVCVLFRTKHSQFTSHLGSSLGRENLPLQRQNHRRIYLRRDYIQQWLVNLKLLCIRERLLSIFARTQCLRPRKTTVWLADFFLPSLRQATRPGNPLHNRRQTLSSSTTKLVLCKTKYVKEIAKC